MTATIRLDTEHHVGEIDPRIFGGFLEHLGRAVYEGVYDPGSPLSDEKGFRRDVLAALRRMRMRVVRYPGGNFVSNYDWKDGIGPVELRPARPDFAWKTLEPNSFGTDDFMAWCSALDTAPMLAVNLGTGTPKGAAELVEYCNMPGGTYWSDRRKANGSPEPYRVPIWCLGNEMDGPWQAGHVPAREYAMRAEQAAKLMKGIDPSIELVVAGSSGRQMATYLEWDRQVLEYTWDHVEYLSAHRYSRNDRDDSAWFLAEGLEIERIVQDYAGLLAYVRGVKKSNRKVYIAFDEWNVWYRARGGVYADGNWTQAPHLLEEVYNLEDALVCAQYLNAFIRNADVVRIACIAQIVNVIAPILTRPDGMLIQSIYWPFVEYAEHARGRALRPVVDGPTYMAGERGEAPVLDVSATYATDTGDLSLFMVNRHLSEGLECRVKVVDRMVSAVKGATVLTAPDVKTHNTWEAPDAVKPAAGTAEVSDDAITLSLPARSMTVLRLSTSERP